MLRFYRSEHGIAATLGLVMMPALILMTVVLVDIGRGNNAHSDLQAAADAMALAGARELDGGTDAITRAQAAMSNIDNSVSYLGESATDSNIDLQLGGANNAYTVIFLSDIPASDDTPLTATYLTDHATTDGEDANYVYVRAQSQDLLTTGNLLGSTPVAATAVATYSTAACNVTPLYICNPFETQDIDLQTAFASGYLYGRMIRLHPNGSDTAMPGNFGFLQVTGNNDNTTASANAIRNIFAGDYNPTCYSARRVTSKPGAATSIGQGINVRFDIYDGPMGNDADVYPPDINVRKGFVTKDNGNQSDPCNTELTSDPSWARSFPDNAVMAPPGQGAPGAYVGSGNWDINTYWQTNFQTTPPAAVYAAANYPGGSLPTGMTPSRYDVYNYEVSTMGTAGDLVATPSVGSDPLNTDSKEEVGLPMCSQSKAHALAPRQGRRIVFAAIIDCLDQAGNGATEMAVNSYASLFMTRPMVSNGSADGTIDVEVIDITGWGGNGTLDTFVRDEANLVR